MLYFKEDFYPSNFFKKLSNEFWKCRKPKISYFCIIGYPYFVLNNEKDNLDKFDIKLDESIFLNTPFLALHIESSTNIL